MNEQQIKDFIIEHKDGIESWRSHARELTDQLNKGEVTLLEFISKMFVCTEHIEGHIKQIGQIVADYDLTIQVKS